MPRAIWKGAISFGLVTVPVGLYTATERAAEIHKRELALARQLIETLATGWDPTRYRDTYRDVLLKVIEQKAKGEPISVPAPRKPARVVSLMDALQQSLRAPRRAPARAAGRRRPARKRAA